MLRVRNTLFLSAFWLPRLGFRSAVNTETGAPIELAARRRKDELAPRIHPDGPGAMEFPLRGRAGVLGSFLKLPH
jgi:hypothetical protein